MGKKKPKSKAAKPAAAVSESNFKSEIDIIAAAICSANQTVFLKLCRLCESKDGPFLNIFDADKVTAKKIDELMPFRIAENDDLPHKICFRCSAKVEELYEFIQKCIKTQQRLNTALGKKEPLSIKTKTRALWEEKLNKNNISNDDICDALIKKAMEGIKDIPTTPSIEEEKTATTAPKKNTRLKAESTSTKKDSKGDDSKSESDIENSDMPLKQLKAMEKFDKKNFIPSRTSRSQNPEALLDGLPDYKRNFKKTRQTAVTKQNIQEATDRNKKKVVQSSSEDESSSDTEITIPPKEEIAKKEPKSAEPTKPFNIMDHVSIIKVNGVGVLFQCKLCNRNFLKKDVVMTHGCAKSGGVPKLDFTKNIIRPEPPKASVVKYINTKVDGVLGKPIENETVNEKAEEEPKKIILGSKPKPRIGPASRIKRNDTNPMIGMTVSPIEEPPPQPTAPETPMAVASPSVQFPAIPSLNSRYKLVPGPNNTFQLVEESPPNDAAKTNVENGTSKSTKKRKNEDIAKPTEPKTSKPSGKEESTAGGSNSVLHRRKGRSSEVINLDDSPPDGERSENSNDQPYPVGLFSTLPHHSSIYPTSVVTDPPFTTPAMKKQSYTIVQTGNPSKLLISTKPQPPLEEPAKKRQKKSKHESKEDTDKNKQPFNVTLEDSVPQKDSFFTFINVDPLLQPSYVLPTDNIIQESQISTSTSASKSNTDSKDKDKYSCNMCDEKFSREKKLLAHIHSHYNKMDEEDMLREKNKKRAKKH